MSRNASKRRTPNILVITTHDSGRHFGCYGVDAVHTPAIDALAGDGVLLTRWFAAVPICSASRVTMLTGRYPQSHGLMDLTGFGWAMNDDERHLSHILRDAGYATHLFGLQHEVKDVERLGFEEVHAQPVAGRGRADAISIAEQIAGFLGERQPDESPFYAQVGFFETHTPWTDAEPDTSKGVYVPPHIVPDEAARGLMAQLQGVVRQVDDAVRTVVDALADTGLEDDTLLVFTTDHGIEISRSKWTVYDPGIEVAMVMRWPRGRITDSAGSDRGGSARQRRGRKPRREPLR